MTAGLPGRRASGPMAPLDARPIRVAIVEDQEPLRLGLAALVGTEPGFAASGAWGSVEDSLPELLRDPPDVVLFDLGLPGASGIEGVRRLHAARPGVAALVLTVFADSEHVFEAICAGATGYLLKDTPPERLIAAIREIAAGGAPMSPEIARKVVTTFARVAPPPRSDHELSPRELELLELLAAGHSYKTAARTLGIALDTVRFHVRNVYAKLHVHSKSEAVTLALRLGMVR